jgi:hypothetical protein
VLLPARRRTTAAAASANLAADVDEDWRRRTGGGGCRGELAATEKQSSKEGCRGGERRQAATPSV